MEVGLYILIVYKSEGLTDHYIYNWVESIGKKQFVLFYMINLLFCHIRLLRHSYLFNKVKFMSLNHWGFLFF